MLSFDVLADKRLDLDKIPRHTQENSIVLKSLALRNTRSTNNIRQSALISFMSYEVIFIVDIRGSHLTQESKDCTTTEKFMFRISCPTYRKKI